MFTCHRRCVRPGDPAGIECAVEIKESVDALFVAIDPDRLTLAAAESSALGARLTERLSDYDESLFNLARTLALEGAADYPNGPHYWNEVVSSFIDVLVARHTSASAKAPRGMLSKPALVRLTEYIFAHLDEPIEVAALAKIPGGAAVIIETATLAKSLGAGRAWARPWTGRREQGITQ
jgi:AraC family transcriptional regulator